MSRSGSVRLLRGECGSCDGIGWVDVGGYLEPEARRGPKVVCMIVLLSVESDLQYSIASAFLLAGDSLVQAIHHRIYHSLHPYPSMAR